jgi:hypothetical protein
VNEEEEETLRGGLFILLTMRATRIREQGINVKGGFSLASKGNKAALPHVKLSLQEEELGNRRAMT